ncbi:DUF1572 family protein [Pontibacter locisalis]|uniref:DUF1572 family protein n=1 Tax=Pontibacter locisalis TaxID=1719035 RepID=A0ABW5IJK5_9BACT
MVQDLIKILTRNQDKLYVEIELFGEEESIWRTSGSISNTAGNLCLHLIGNLNTYVGKTLGNTGYIRDRHAEFSLKNVKREELLRQINKTKQVVRESLVPLHNDDLEKDYPEQVLGYPMTTGFFLVHLSAHLSYHLGQVNYLRRMLES